MKKNAGRDNNETNANAVAMVPGSSNQVLDVSACRLRVSNLDKITHPATGTTQADVMACIAVLAWFAQPAALEIHVPPWRFGADGATSHPDRMVLDLHPGEGAGLQEWAETAHLCRELLVDIGLDAHPFTSGSKGIHLDAPLHGRLGSADVSAVAHELARTLGAEHPELTVWDMKRSLGTSKVLVDGGRNCQSHTTVCPYSLHGRTTRTVAAPWTWEEIADPALRQLDFQEVPARVSDGIDPLRSLGWLPA